MGEAVPHLRHRRLAAGFRGRRPRLLPRSAGQRAHPAQHSLVGAPHQPDAAARFDPVGGAAPLRLGLLRRLDRQPFDVVAAPRAAIAVHRTGETGRPARRAQRRAQIHQRLREIAGPGRRHQWGERRADRLFRGRQGRFDQPVARDHAFNISIDHDGGTGERDRRDGRRRIIANPRKRAQRRFAVRKSSAMIGDHRARAGEQIPRTGIISEARPRRHDVRVVGRREIGDVRPTLGKSGEIACDGSNGRLLQHHFGEPDAVGIGRHHAPWRDTPG